MSDVTDLIERVRRMAGGLPRSIWANRKEIIALLDEAADALERLNRPSDDVVRDSAFEEGIVYLYNFDTDTDRMRAFEVAAIARHRTLASLKQTDAVEAETYRQMHETAKEMGYPSILEALEHLDELKQTDAVGAACQLAEDAIASAVRGTDSGHEHDELIARLAAIRGAK